MNRRLNSRNTKMYVGVQDIITGELNLQDINESNVDELISELVQYKNELNQKECEYRRYMNKCCDVGVLSRTEVFCRAVYEIIKKVKEVYSDDRFNRDYTYSYDRKNIYTYSLNKVIKELAEEYNVSVLTIRDKVCRDINTGSSLEEFMVGVRSFVETGGSDTEVYNKFLLALALGRSSMWDYTYVRQAMNFTSSWLKENI